MRLPNEENMANIVTKVDLQNSVEKLQEEINDMHEILDTKQNEAEIRVNYFKKIKYFWTHGRCFCN